MMIRLRRKGGDISTSNQQDSGSSRVAVVLTLAKKHRYRSSTTVALLILSGLMEGVGIASLLPLLSIASSDEMGSNAPSRWVVRSLDAFGLEATVTTLLGLIVFGLALKAFLFVLAVRQAGYAGIDTATDLRLDLIGALMKARWSYFVSQPSGSITNAVGTEAMRVTAMFTEICHLLAAVIQLILYLFLALLIAWYLTVGALVFAGVLFVLSSVPMRLGRRSGRSQTDLMRSLTHRLTDTLSGLKPLKAMGRESAIGPLLEEEVRELNTAYRGEMLSRAILTALQEPLIAVFLAVGIAIATSTLDMALSEIVFVALIFQRVVSRFGNAQAFYNSVGILESAYTSLAAGIKQAEEEKEERTGRTVPTIEKGIRFQNVSFGYGRRDVFTRASAFLPAGQLTAVTGVSGAGKTTFIDLIVGLVRPDAGDVLIDSVPLTEIDMKQWRDRIGYVGQEVVLLHQTIRDNVALGDPSLTPEEVEQALRDADAWEFICQLPDGQDTVVGEKGLKFSGGQRQRLAIARALVRNPLLLILDEVTTSLDPEAERSIVDTITLLRGRTTIVAISHQPALVAAADHVLRIDNGTVVHPEQTGRTV